MLAVTAAGIGRRRRFRLSGVLDASTCRLAVVIADYERRCGHRRVWLDLTDVRHIDQAALERLRELASEFRASRCVLIVSGVSAQALPPAATPARFRPAHQPVRVPRLHPLPKRAD
jgi:ABC-type transporter Mla MlaB component